MTDTQAFHRARQHERNELAERIAHGSPFSIFQVWLLLDDLSEAEARQVCRLARRWDLSPGETCAVLEEQTEDIHTVLDKLRSKDGRRWPVERPDLSPVLHCMPYRPS